MRLGAAVMMVGLAAETVALACLPPHSPPYVPDPAHASDTTPPGATTVVDVSVVREDEAACGGVCGPDGILEIALEASDDLTPADRMGYQVTRVRGSFPGSALVDGQARLRAVDGTILLSFAVDHPVAVVLEVRAIDLAGNLGPPAEVTVDDAPGGCAVAGRVPLGYAVIAAAAALIVRLRGRRSR